MTIPLAVNHESEVTTWSSSIKDLERQQDRLARVSILPFLLPHHNRKPGYFPCISGNMIQFPPDTVFLTRLAEDCGTAEGLPSKKHLQPITDEVCSLFVSSGTCVTPSSLPSHLLAAINHRITSLEQKLLQTSSPIVDSEPLTRSMLMSNPLHHSNTQRKTSIFEDSLHLSQDTLDVLSE